MTKSKIIEVILTTSNAGMGVENDPFRQVVQLWSKDGKLIADSGTALITKDKLLASSFYPENLD